MLCGISFGFPELFPIGGQIAHVLRTRAPCAIPYCYGTRTRLACVKHAASVRSEPGSNSRLKPVAWAKKNAPIFIGASLPKQIKILAHRIGCQRTYPPVQQKGTTTAE